MTWVMDHMTSTTRKVVRNDRPTGLRLFLGTYFSVSRFLPQTLAVYTELYDTFYTIKIQLYKCYNVIVVQNTI